ncbi:MAG TPA: hypothetical protein PKA64_20465, partial [Myxococcota bacterium]|nr:hypothetical protein [Myxococcota bacterium]
GRPLYGDDGWGVVQGDRKSWERGGAPRGYDLAADPGERTDLGASEGWAAGLGEALGAPVQQVWRVDTHAARANDAVRVEISHPAGLTRVWKAYDPRSTTEGLEPRLEGAAWVLDVPAGRQLPGALYALGADPTSPAGLRLVVRRGDHVAEGTCAGPGAALIAPVDDRLKVSVDVAVVPSPFGQAVPGSAPELTQQLKELGYAD